MPHDSADSGAEGSRWLLGGACYWRAAPVCRRGLFLSVVIALEAIAHLSRMFLGKLDGRRVRSEFCRTALLSIPHHPLSFHRSFPDDKAGDGVFTHFPSPSARSRPWALWCFNS